jgi:dihydrofolate synthase/folylpolyglutamate synthase
MSADGRIDDAYNEALDYLYGLINFELKRHDRYMESKLDLDRPLDLMAFLGSPHQNFPSIHIAGTKGKGSVAALCAACLHASGLKVGLYTSPHVREFRERIRVLTAEDADGRISREWFIELMQRMRSAINEIPGITWFEVVTAVAFLYFAQQEIDVAVLEVGLGGRLDATNVVTPLVSVITSLSYDHTEFLGNTLSEIAGEKGGIIKAGIPVVTSSQKAEALKRLVDIAGERHSKLYVVGRDWVYRNGDRDVTDGKQELFIQRSADPSFIPHGSSFRLALAGAHQLENATVALAALSHVRSRLPQLALATIAEGIENVEWTGRLQIVHQEEGTPTILVDCAHNVDSAAKLRFALAHDYHYDRLWIVLGVTIGKDVAGMMKQLLPLAEATIATVSSHPRASDTAAIASLAAELGYEVIQSGNVQEAMFAAWKMAGPRDLICVTGSIFVVGDLLNEWDTLQIGLLRTSQLA